LRQGENWLLRLSDQMDLTSETVPGVPLVELFGCSRVLVEHHRGVICYGSCEIRLRVDYGQVCILGKSLELVKINRGQLVICGDIACVQLIRKEV